MTSVAIIGAGAGGLCAFAELRRGGFDDVTVFESGDGVGGTWRHNTYPGAACDIPSHLYCFSFAPKRDWSRRFAPQPEILEYFESVADRIGIRPHLRLECTVTDAVLDESTGRWSLRWTRDGREETADFDVVVSALGQLNRPFVPEIEGLDRFAGPSFHSARWDHGVDLAGRRVGVVGNAASAIQLVPELAREVGELTIFQRSPNWIVPKPDRIYGPWKRRAFERVPGMARWSRIWTFARLELMFFGVIRRRGPLSRYIRRRATAELGALASERLPVEALVPDFDPGCNRLLLSSDYYATLLRPNVSVCTSHIRRLDETSVETEDGARHELDAVVFATGFRSTEFLVPLAVVGRGGETLADRWADGSGAHLGVAVPGFPNFFMIYGPNTNLGHNSILFMIEAQVRWITAALKTLRDGRRSVEVRPEAFDRFAARIDRDLGATVWGEGCRSWYKDGKGRIVNNWPNTASAYWWRTRRLDPADLV